MDVNELEDMLDAKEKEECLPLKEVITLTPEEVKALMDESDPEFESDEEEMLVDFFDSLVLLRNAKNLLCYLSDEKMNGNITESQRRDMRTLVHSLTDYLDEVGPQYDLE